MKAHDTHAQTPRMTRQRRVMLEELRDAEDHPSAQQLYDRVRVRLPKVSLGTVYRNLEVLSASGVIRKLELGCSQRRYDGDTEVHYHICCIRCGRIEDAPVPLFTNLEAALRAVSSYMVVGHRLEFTGICPDCRRLNGAGEVSKEETGESG